MAMQVGRRIRRKETLEMGISHSGTYSFGFLLIEVKRDKSGNQW